MHTYQSLGGWPYFASDYWSKGYYGWLLTEEFESLGNIIDPYGNITPVYTYYFMDFKEYH